MTTVKRPKMCIHRVIEGYDCLRCTRLIAKGKIAKRKFYTQQRVWQLEQKAKKRCEICGRRKGKCPSKARCAWCLSADVKRKRKVMGIREEQQWRPGRPGKPRHISGGVEKMREFRVTDKFDIPPPPA